MAGPEPPIEWSSRPTRDKTLHVLGYGVPVNAELGSLNLFPHAVQGWEGEPVSLREVEMMQHMGQITDKPGWTQKIKDGTIVDKWRAELKQHKEEVGAEDNNWATGFTDAQFDFCIEELSTYADQSEQHGFFPAIDATATAYKSDLLIGSDLKASLATAVAFLEDVPDSRKDWHPKSDNKVLDLVHPSLCPLVYGRTKVLTDATVPLVGSEKFMGCGEIIAVPEDVVANTRDTYYRFRNNANNLFSRRFQWLPCEVAFKGTDEVEITSYINNLHPERHADLYQCIEVIMARIIPMWNATLSSTRPRQHATEATGGDKIQGRRFVIDTPPFYTFDHWPEQPEGHEDDPDFDEDEWQETAGEQAREACIEKIQEHFTALEPRSYTEYSKEHMPIPANLVDLRTQFATQGLQVIVKLANIHLTPDLSTYPGGTWHIEGQLNEHIVATALYYYSCSNITTSSLAFREIPNSEAMVLLPEQNEWWWVEEMYGCQQDEEIIQDLGSVTTPENRVLTFPNVFMHQLQPFELQDKTQPGHRKILALFLVDPHVRIPSTANVGPQQKEWIRDSVFQAPKITDLPPEVAENVLEQVEGFIGIDEAKVLREELIAERSALDNKVKSAIVGAFSFCEH